MSVTATEQAQQGFAPPPLTPAWQTAPFWTTHIFAFLSLATGLGWIGPNFSHDHQPVVNAVAIIMAALAPALFALAHSHRAAAHQTAVSGVISAAITAGQLILNPTVGTTAKAPVDPATGAGQDPATGALGLVTLFLAVGLILGIVGALLLIIGLIHALLSVTGLVLLIVGLVIVAVCERA